MLELKYLKRIENKEYERIKNIGRGTNKGEGEVKILYYIHIKINSNEKKMRCAKYICAMVEERQDDKIIKIDEALCKRVKNENNLVIVNVDVKYEMAVGYC